MENDIAPIVLTGLLKPGTNFDDLAWERFREGVDIHRIYGTQDAGASAALLRYRPGASLPYHVHTAHEHILVLSGSQHDGWREGRAGTVTIYPPGSGHAIVSAAGCVALAIWHGPVRFPE